MAKIIDQHRALVEALYAKAEQDSLHWEDTGFGGVQTKVGDVSIVFSKEVDFHDQPSIRVEISNSAGQVVDTFDNDYFGQLRPQHAPFDNYWPLLSEIYTIAIRSARGADKILSQLLENLAAKAVVEPQLPRARTGFSDDLDDDVPF